MIGRWVATVPHRGTTATLQAAYPFMAEAGLGARGTYVGRDLFGGSFCYDPFELYAAGALTNPNMLVIGQVGSGKSALVKTFLWRQQEFGRAAWVADPKGEYSDLAAACGVTPIRLGPGQTTRLNPLDAGPGAADLPPAEVTGRRLRLLTALAATALGRALVPVEHAALDLALTAIETTARNGGGTVAAAVPVLPDLVGALLEPSVDAAGQLRMDIAALTAASRDVALVMRRMCTGDLAGMFDAPTTLTAADLDGPLVVLNLAEVYQHNREALPLVMTCATAWLQAAVHTAGAGRRYVVVDEAWALLSSIGTARWLQQSYKLSRAHGIANIAVMHRLSDLTAAGPAGSEQAQLARGLLADAGTRVIYTQPSSEVAQAADLLALTSTETELLPHLRQGTGLWKVGTRSFVVEHRRSGLELAMTDTDTAMLSDQ